MENYKAGGEGIGYHDTTPGNNGVAYRSDDVDIQSCSDGSSCFNVGWIETGEWLAYNIDVASSANYIFTIRVASPYSGKRLHIEVDGVNVTGSLSVPRTGGWQTWSNLTTKGIALGRGRHTLRLVAETGEFNLNYVAVNR